MFQDIPVKEIPDAETIILDSESETELMLE